MNTLLSGLLKRSAPLLTPLQISTTLRAIIIDCPSDEFVPIPTSTAKPYIEVREKAAAACRAAQLMLKNGYEAAKGSTVEDAEAARIAARNAMQSLNTGKQLSAAQTNQFDSAIAESPTSALLIHSILVQYDMEVVKDAARIRNYITNKLIVESDDPDPKVRMDALKTLGKIGGVDLFVERKEVVIQTRPTGELEDNLRNKLRRIMGVVETQETEDARVKGYTPAVTAVNPEINMKNELQALKEAWK